MENSIISFGVAGGGTAGLVSALMLRQAFPKSEITVIYSTEIGIVGVGEGSTEHWRKFMDRCSIPILELIAETDATHKYGLRFENWSKAHPDYFHSVTGDEAIYAWGLYATYMGFLSENKLLTKQTSSTGLYEDRIRKVNLHNNTNQYHFDTFKLNSYLSKVAARRNVKFVNDKIVKVNKSAKNGNIVSVNLEQGFPVEADFWIDATGFIKLLTSEMGNDEWNSFDKYLLMDTAFAFPTDSNPNGKIHPYTRAKAMSSGWAWEIPTQLRRGNGCVYSSSFAKEEDVVAEISSMLNEDIEPLRRFSFNAGHLKSPWVKNCCAVGLSSAFVEPIEATSIGGTIQQLEMLIPYIASYRPENWASQRSYNKSFNIMMDNILSMVRLHYISDRDDTPFWREMAKMPVNESLQELLDLWQETTLKRSFIPDNDGQMFHIAHFLHVAQGQDVINTEPIVQSLKNLDVYENVRNDMASRQHERFNHETIDHAEALSEIYEES